MTETGTYFIKKNDHLTNCQRGSIFFQGNIAASENVCKLLVEFHQYVYTFIE